MLTDFAQSSILLSLLTQLIGFMRRLSSLALCCALFFLALPGHAAVVKKSVSGLCHPPQSSYYSRTKDFIAYESVEACIRNGGRLPVGLTLEPASPNKYERAHFGRGWTDSDRDCQNSRMEALIAHSTIPVQFGGERHCRVVRGRWVSPFTGKVIHDASQVDIDHVVPLKWAWDRGAGLWTQEKREHFANDPVNLWSVEFSLNRQKGAKGPDKWMPPAGKCQYVSRFIRIAKIYELRPTREESGSFRALLSRHCDSRR